MKPPPKTICIDCNILIWGVRKFSTTGQEEMVSRAEAFISNCSKDQSQILVPTVAMAEFLTRTNPPDVDAIESGFESLFIVANFDIRAARIFADLHRSYIAANGPKAPNGVSAVKMKKDFMIVATALAHGASYIVSNDADVGKFAQGKIQVSPLPEKSQQTEFLGG
jgi:predicted nucleic acid-binding protein